MENTNCSKQKEIEQQEYTCPFWLWKSIRKRKQGNRKKQGKAKGVTNQYFIQPAPWIKILCKDRSKVQYMYSCSLEKRQTSLKTGVYVLINYFYSTFYILWLFQGSVLGCTVEGTTQTDPLCTNRIFFSPIEILMTSPYLIKL